MRTSWRSGTLLFAGLALGLGLGTFADDRPQQPSAKELAQKFVYPGAVRYGEEREGARMYQAKFTTADPASDMTNWYSHAAGTSLGRDGSEGIAFNSGQQPGVRVSVADDSRQPGNESSAIGEPRPLYLKVLIKKTNEAVVVVVVSRGQDEPRTHVALTWLDNQDQ